MHGLHGVYQGHRSGVACVADADLIGIPIRLVISERNLKEGEGVIATAAANFSDPILELQQNALTLLITGIEAQDSGNVDPMAT